jgi:translocation and assembly module TamB
MTRRRRIFIAFVAIMVFMIVGIAGGILMLTRSEWGKAKGVAYALGIVNRAIQGTLYVGRVSGSIFTGMNIDTLEIRDRNDSVFVAAANVSLAYDPRDLLDRRLLFRNVRFGRLTAHIFEDSVGMFNFRRIFPSGPPGPPQEVPRQAWGQFIKLEDVIVDSANVRVTTRWAPDSAQTRSVRDSITTFNLQRTDKVFFRGPGSIYESKTWTNGHVELDSARLDDRQQGGRRFAIRHLSIDESDPPFLFRNARGLVRIQGDSIWADVPHFELPGSKGNMTGKVWWGGGAPARFDLAIRADTVSMEDIAWVYPTLPDEGGGKMNLRILSQRDPRIIDYVLTDIDVRTTESRLRGDMTFGIGAPVTILKDVDLTAQPLDFRLVEQLAGEPLPYPWRGTISGSIIASGGPLNAFRVDTSDLVFRDANVPGAVTIGKLRGMLDIQEPSEVVFNGVNLDLDQLDLRTLQFLMPQFPRLNGQVAGRAVLDSSWLDVRFHDADLTHTDGSGPGTRMVGAGRVTFAEVTTYDVAMTAQPFSFTTFARAYTDSRIPLQGEYTGPIRIQGTTDDLSITTELRGPAGMFAYDGRVDGDSVGGYALNGTLTFENLDLRTLLDTAITPVTALNGSAALAVRFDSLFNLVGSTDIAFGRSRLDSLLVHDGARVQLRFAEGRVSVFGSDTVETSAGRAIAAGALGLGGSVRDSMTIAFSIDSLGGLRPFLKTAPGDSLNGTIAGSLTLRGSIDTLDVGGVVNANDFVYPGIRAQHIRLTPALTNVAVNMGGTLNLHTDTLSLSGVRFSNVDGDLSFGDGRIGSYNVLATELNGPVIASAGALSFDGDTATVRIDSLSLMLDDKRYTLQRPSSVRVEPTLVVVDTVELRAEDDQRVTFAASIPDSLPIAARLVLQAIPLADVSTIAQTRVPLGGDLSGTLEMTGTRASPRMNTSATLNSVTAGDVKVAQVAISGAYADRRLSAEARVNQADSTVLRVDANYPIDLALVAIDKRIQADTMRIRVQSPDVGLDILESFTNKVRAAGGTFKIDMELAGPVGGAQLNGTLAVNRGAVTLPDVGITLREINADLIARNDTVRIDTLTMVSGDQLSDRFTMAGWIARPFNADSVSFDLRGVAREFHVIGDRRLADLYVTANVTWAGTDQASSATGVVTVDRGMIALPETSDKELFSIEDWRELGIDSALVGQLGLLPTPATRFVRGLSAENVQVVMGPDVWLQSQDANIKLTGAVNLTVARADRFSEDQLALTGDLATERGTYRLNVSPLQRTFQVQSGLLRFNGDPGFNPALDIRAVYTSRSINATYGGRNDVRVGVRIRGTLANPALDLYAADSLLGLSQSDLLSYVLFDQPSFSVGSGTSSAMALLLGTFTSFASSYAARYASGLVDFVQLQTSGEGANAQLGDIFSIGGTQLAIGKQVSDRMFVSLTSGLCTFLPTSNSAAASPSLLSTIGLKLEYQFGRSARSGVAAAYEPSFDKLVCGLGERGFSTSKKQVGFDFFRIWRR